jgi:trimeric autotransporter adhesin
MKLLRLLPILIAGAASFVGVARAQQPPDSVSGDACYNTAMGTDALLNNSNGTCPNSSAGQNTAAGTFALEANTTGFFNSGFGAFALWSNTTGEENTATGTGALPYNTTGSANTATGFNSLFYNTTGYWNTGTGAGALATNTTGYYNTASGVDALAYNSTGYDNTASGTFALFYNSTGIYNTALGFSALYNNTTARNNTAVGYEALYGAGTYTGAHNSAFGYQTLYSDNTGSYNNAIGDNTLAYNTTGNNNNAVGYAALYSTTTGSSNNAQGYYALARLTTGSSNTGLGEYAGYNQTTGSNNIYIGNQGVAGESAVIKIGTAATQTTAFIAGITGTNVTGGATVVVNSSGQLGVMSSSRQYKEDIHPLGEASERVYDLHPVAFRYRQADEKGEKPIQYGLVAEEVAETLPELVVHDAAGRPATVAYQVLPTLLLNELQKEHQRVAAQSEEIAALRSQVADLERLATELVAAERLRAGTAEPVTAPAASH